MGSDPFVRPLLFVDWGSVSARFTALMWWIAAILVAIVLLHAVARNTDPRASAYGTGRGSVNAGLHAIVARRP